MTSDTDALALATRAAREWLSGYDTQPAGALADFEAHEGGVGSGMVVSPKPSAPATKIEAV